MKNLCYGDKTILSIPETYSDLSGSISLGTNPIPNPNNIGISIVGTTLTSGLAIFEAHNNYAVGIDLYTHADAGFRAPYINLYKSRGMQLTPTALTYTGYELDSMGGINFGGWDGEKYFPGSASIFTQSDENWTATNHAGHISIYGTAIGGTNPRQLVQFGGKDPSGVPGNNIIFYDNLSFNGNLSGNPALFPTSNPAKISFRSGANDRDISVTALNFVVTGAAPIVNANQIGFGAMTAVTASAGANGPAPTQVLGYLIANAGGVSVKIPYYAI